jgi:hypothetical protein
MDNMAFAKEAGELRALALLLLEVSQDSRRMGEDLADMVRGVVGQQCDSLEERARAVLQALEAGGYNGWE